MSGPESKRQTREITTVVMDANATVADRDRGVLTLLSGSEAGRVVGFSSDGLKLGRSDECEIVFDDASLSRVHALAMRVGKRFVLRDEGSTNGTFVNEARISGAVELADGDRIQLGSSTTLRFALVDAQEEKTLIQVFEAGRTDALTHVANRKSFDERLDVELSYAIRHGAPLSLVLLDIDFFKKVNDGYGHPAGDAVLAGVASRLAARVRGGDFLARYGGEEFAVIARGSDLRGARALADGLRTTVGASPIAFEGKSIAVTTSAGVASLACLGDSKTKASLIALADARLYKAKQGGRNRVVTDD